ncbi:MAG: cation diffusion facilitator family transporter [Victivallaceae bacterium]|nr:cation diffusion facilitator family transporter [Victivallaceae bacterium]
MKKNTTSHSAASAIHQIRFVTLWGMAVNLLLVLGKAIGGICFHSQALFADAIHSLSDLITDFAVLFGVKYWSAPPDHDHPYGHGRIETLISAFIGLALAVVAVGLVWDAVSTLRAGIEKAPKPAAFFIALGSIGLKEWLFRWTRNVARRVGSKALEANAWHHRSDAISSIPAAVAIALAYFFPTLHFVDPLGAILVSFFILHAAWKITMPTLHELSDGGVPREVEERIYRMAAAVEGIRGVHGARTRNTGNAILVDLHILVDPDMTVLDGHKLSHRVKEVLVRSDLGIADAVIHLEPYQQETRKTGEVDPVSEPRD